jgi:hypothetical protein
MKKVSTRAAAQSRNISQPKLSIGLDLGDRNCWYCGVDEGAASPDECERVAGSLRHNAAQPDRVGNRDTSAVDQPVAQWVGGMRLPERCGRAMPF